MFLFYVSVIFYSEFIMFVCSDDKLLFIQLKAFSLVIVAKDFNPEKYEALCSTASGQYCKTGSPTAILQVNYQLYSNKQ